MMKLDVVEFGIVFGCIWSSCIFALVLASRRSPKAEAVVALLSKVYRGFNNTLSGVFLGAVWGFIDGAVSGLLIAWVYNKTIS